MGPVSSSGSAFLIIGASVAAAAGYVALNRLPNEDGNARSAERGTAADNTAPEQSSNERTGPPARRRKREVERLRVRVIRRYPHATDAFTQGLLFEQGKLLESTGLRAQSTLREVELASGNVLRRTAVPDNLFAEGLAQVGGDLIQLTWQDEQALVYDRATFQLKKRHRYEGEGWGLCYDGKDLVMSDGTDQLTFRDPDSFAVRRRVSVTLEGQPARDLNELECVRGRVYANIWQREDIVAIDPQTGIVRAVIDARGLLKPEQRHHTDVLNGIAYDPKTKHFFLTGKLWPTLFEVEFVPE